MSEDKPIQPENPEDQPKDGSIQDVIAVSGMYENWFLDYASYVILERAVPALEDGLKPVQRRILHAMKEMDDGRFHKVANIIGQTMQYHPHGDAAIGDALVGMGQKELVIETQGNWGDVRTGDRAAAPRYIEARLSKLALAIAYNNQTTEWQLSYDGRKKEPVNLPMKFPLLLAHGVEGIAVGLATKILPHNFNELCKGSMDILKGKKTNLLPDFPFGGKADFSDYKGGLRGGRVRVRADIEIDDKKTLVIKSIPYGQTTSSLIDSIIKANDKGKIKVKKVVDNTAEHVEVLVELPTGTSPELTMDALYAFTDCEISISPNSCVIIDDKPHFIDINELLKISTFNTKELLRRELEIRKNELLEKWHFASLEKIFIEERIYRDIEECETWEAVIQAIDKGLEPFKPKLNREVTEEDIVRLTEIRIKRISKFDSFKADENIKKLEDELEQVKYHLEHLTDYAIKYFNDLLERFGKGRERKTEITSFDTIEATQVAANNVKLFVNRKEGFIGTGLKKDEFVTECSDIDDIIVFRREGIMVVKRIDDKVFVGKDILHVGVWNRGDERTIYNVIYRDGKKGINYAKRFAVKAVTRDKEYDLTRGDGSKILYFTSNPNGESEVVTVHLTQGSRARKKIFDYDFGDLAIKGRNSKGNIVTRYPVRKVEQKEVGASTIGGLNIWVDEINGRLNTDERGKYLGEFDTGDTILAVYKDGTYETSDYELINRFEMQQVEIIKKHDPQEVISAVYYDGERKKYFVKRFQIETTSLGQKFPFITENRASQLYIVSLADRPIISYKDNARDKELTQDLSKFIDIKGWKSVGNTLGLKGGISKLKLMEEINEKRPEEKRLKSQEGFENDKKENNEKGTESNTVKKVDAPAQKEDNNLSSGSSIEWDLDNDEKKLKNKRDDESQGSLF